MNSRLSKSIFILAIVSLLTAGVAFAQGQHGQPDRERGPTGVEEHLARLSHALGLSDQQAVDMLIVLQETAEQKAALHRRIMEQMRPELCAQREAAEKAILEILTPDQQERFLRARERKGHGPVRRLGVDC